jgi:hypothetical protein
MLGVDDIELQKNDAPLMGQKNDREVNHTGIGTSFIEVIIQIQLSIKSDHVD